MFTPRLCKTPVISFLVYCVIMRLNSNHDSWNQNQANANRQQINSKKRNEAQEIKKNKTTPFAKKELTNKRYEYH